MHKERVCDTILPRLTKRYILEEAGELPARKSLLEQELLEPVSEPEAQDEEMEQDEPEIDNTTNEIMELAPPTTTTDKKKKPSKSKVKALFKKSKKPSKKDEEEQQEEESKSGFKDVSLNYHETNILRANLGLKPLQ